MILTISDKNKRMKNKNKKNGYNVTDQRGSAKAPNYGPRRNEEFNEKTKRKIHKLKKKHDKEAARNRSWFKHDGNRLKKPASIEVAMEEYNVLIDSSIEGLEVDKLDKNVLSSNGDYLIILETAGASRKTIKYLALTISAIEIIRARTQRLQLVYLSGEKVVADMIAKALDIEGPDSEELKFIEAHKEDFLSSPDSRIVLQDVRRILERNY